MRSHQSAAGYFRLQQPEASHHFSTAEGQLIQYETVYCNSLIRSSLVSVKGVQKVSHVGKLILTSVINRIKCARKNQYFSLSIKHHQQKTLLLFNSLVQRLTFPKSF